MTNRLLIFLLLTLAGCAAKAKETPPDLCMPEYRECVKQFTSEKVLCLVSGDTEAHCKEMFEIGLKECRDVHDRCAASYAATRPVEK